MLDLGLEPYLIASTLIGVVAQRLVRMICKNCRQEKTISAQELAAFGCRIKTERARAWTGGGCSMCRSTGYYGRIGIYEVLSVSPKIKKMIHMGSSENAIREQAVKEGMKSLKYDACMKMLSGITTMEEIARVTY